MSTSQWFHAVTGLLSGLALFSGVCQFWLHCGTSLAAQTGLASMLMLAIAIRSVLPASWRSDLLPQAVRIFALSAWTVALPSLFETSWCLLASFKTDPTSSILAQSCWFGVIACVALLVPAVLCRAPNCRNSVSDRIVGIGLVIGILIGALGLAPWIGVDGCGLFAAVLGLVAFLVTIVSWSHSHKKSVEQTHIPTSTLTPPAVVWQVRLSGLSALLAIGLLWPVVQRVVRQIVPDSFTLMATEWAVLIAGLTWGQSVVIVSLRRVMAWSGLGLACWIWLCFATLPLSIRLALNENAYVSQVWLLLPMRLLFAGLVLGPIAFCGGLMCGVWSGCQKSRVIQNLSIALVLFAGTAASWLLPVFGVSNTVTLATSLLLLAAGVACDWQAARRWFVFIQQARLFGRIGWLATVVLILFAVTAPAWVLFEPAHAAKVLFDTGVFVSHRSGAPWNTLPVLDEGRAVAVVEGDCGTLTAWKFQGSRFLIRQNGVPKGTLAGDTRLAPRFGPDVLPSVLPLVIHEHPQSVLLLGLRGGESLTAAAAFPVQRVLCVEADRGAIGLCRELLGRAGGLIALDDDRVETRVCEPSLAVRGLCEQFDVIVASSDQPSLPAAANGFTQEYFRAASRCLTEDGLLAVRFPLVDLGPRPLRVLAKTMSSVFAEIAAVEMAPGEMLFLATNSECGFAREGLVDRLQRPHVRQVLASIGWDWSTPLRLPIQDNTAIRELSDQSGVGINTCSHSTWPFRLPMEVMRWDNKFQQVRQELAKREQFLGLWGGAAAGTPEVAIRLSEWELSRQIIRRHSDEFWAYRKEVRAHLTKSPRSLIQQVSVKPTKSGLHPDDERRVGYFRTLGEVARIVHPTEADFDRIRRFATPFDPLISPFLHQEIVEMCPRCERREWSQELHHRLAAIYFSTPADRSIRNVAEALQFVNSTPDAIPDPAERFDQLNALMQRLVNRWDARGEFQPTSSRVALNDIERSIAATEVSFATMDHLAASGVVNVADWSARKQHLERRLVRPLRTYRGDVLKHYVKNEHTKNAVGNTPTSTAPAVDETFDTESPN